MTKCLASPSEVFAIYGETTADRAKILEIGPFPPPYSGWSLRIHVVKNELERAGHICTALNLGANRKVMSQNTSAFAAAGSMCTSS